MRRLFLYAGPPLLAFALAGAFAWALDQPAVRISSAGAGPRSLEDQTRAAVVRDYLAAWHTMDHALQENDPDVLDAEFVGAAREKLAETALEQRTQGFQTLYQDRSHDIQLVFYSPEGLSIELLDRVEYDVEIVDHGKIQGRQHVRARYLAVLSPTEVRWKVRIFQALPE